jgi:hypothetical protein
MSEGIEVRVVTPVILDLEPRRMRNLVASKLNIGEGSELVEQIAVAALDEDLDESQRLNARLQAAIVSFPEPKDNDPKYTEWLAAEFATKHDVDSQRTVLAKLALQPTDDPLTRSVIEPKSITPKTLPEHVRLVRAKYNQAELTVGGATTAARMLYEDAYQELVRDDAAQKVAKTTTRDQILKSRAEWLAMRVYGERGQAMVAVMQIERLAEAKRQKLAMDVTRTSAVRNATRVERQPIAEVPPAQAPQETQPEFEPEYTTPGPDKIKAVFAEDMPEALSLLRTVDTGLSLQALEQAAQLPAEMQLLVLANYARNLEIKAAAGDAVTAVRSFYAKALAMNKTSQATPTLLSLVTLVFGEKAVVRAELESLATPFPEIEDDIEPVAESASPTEIKAAVEAEVPVVITDSGEEVTAVVDEPTPEIPFASQQEAALLPADKPVVQQQPAASESVERGLVNGTTPSISRLPLRRNPQTQSSSALEKDVTVLAPPKGTLFTRNGGRVAAVPVDDPLEAYRAKREIHTNRTMLPLSQFISPEAE